MKKKINWNLISNITTIISMAAVLIGFVFMANVIHKQNEKLTNLNKRIGELEQFYQVYDNVHQYYYQFDDGIRKVE